MSDRYSFDDTDRTIIPDPDWTDEQREAAGAWTRAEMEREYELLIARLGARDESDPRSP